MDEKQKAYSEWLVVRCQQGDESALGALLELWCSKFLSYASYRLSEREAAQDAVQEALVAICRNLYKLSDPASFPRWSYTIVERRCVDWQRKRVRERQILAEDDTETAGQAVTDASEATDADLDSHRLLEILEPELRALVRLYYLEELSVSDIVKIYKLPSGTVKSRLFYARKKMQEFLEKSHE